MAKSDLSLGGDGYYAPVAERVRLFYERYPTGRIVTVMVSRTAEDVVFRAAVYRDASDPMPAATGWAAEREGDGDINTVACLENTETSAVGRALANLGLTASRERPSAEEMAKADRARVRYRRVSEPAVAAESSSALDTWLQLRADRAADALELLSRAERRGLSAQRARIVREHITRADTALGTIARVTRTLGDWLDWRLDRGLGRV